MDADAFEANVYKKICEVFVKNIDDQEKREVSTAYIKYLHKTYDSMFEESKDTDYDAVASVCVKKEKLIHLELDATSKKAFLFPDEKFLALQDLSFEIAEIARSKKMGNEIDLNRSKEEYIELLNACVDSVSDTFKFSAERLLSESLMDVAYIFDEDSAQSFRTSIV